MYILNEELLHSDPEQARNAERILGANYQHRCSNVTFDQADLIDGTLLRAKQPHAGNGTEEKDPNGDMSSSRNVFYTEN